jgi:mannosyltransferase OCH1-like enzyme
VGLLKRAYTSLQIRIREFPLITLVDRPAIKVQNQRIPSVCYQTWTNEFLGRTHHSEVLKFREINPDLSWKLFVDSEMTEYMREHWGHHPIYNIYDKAIYGPMKADIFRYCILFDRGGYYFDISKGCKIPIASLHEPNATALISYERNECIIPPSSEFSKVSAEPSKVVLQWGFGFIAGHRILDRAIQLIVENYEHYSGKIFSCPKDAILAFTGPGLFTKAVRETLSLFEEGEVQEAGIDFNGGGIPALPGSNIRYFTTPHYTQFSNSPILRGPK